MKKRWIGLILAAVCVLGGCGRQQKTEAKPEKQLVIGYSIYRPFMDHDENNNAQGIDADLAREACARMGYEPVFVQIKWEDRQRVLDDHEVDCIWNGFSMTDTDGDYQWAGPYMESRHVVVVPADSQIESLSDLEGKTIGIRAEGQTEQILLENEKNTHFLNLKDIYSFSNLQEVKAALLNGYCDGVCGKEPVWREMLKDRKAQFRFLEEKLGVTQLGIAFGKVADEELTVRLTETLDAMRQDKTTEKILEKYGLTDERTGE